MCKKNILLFFASLFLIYSCKIKNEPKTVKYPLWKPGIAAQLLDLHLNLKDVVTDQDVLPTYIVEGSDKLYTFIYSDTVFSEKLADKLILPKQSANETFTVPAVKIPPFITVGSYVDSIKTSQSFAVSNGEKLNLIELLSGNLNITLSSKFKHDVTLVVKFPYVKDAQNKAFTKTYNITNGGSAINDNISLSGYKIDLTKGGTTQNSLDYTLIFTLIKKSNTINAGENSLSVGISLDQLKYSYLEGFLGKQKIDIPADSVEIDLFKNAFKGEIYFKNPKFVLNLTNELGIPMDILVNKLTTRYVDKTSSPVNITGPAIGTPRIINSPTTRGNVALDSLVYDNASTSGTLNQSIQNAFKPAPFKILYDAECNTNPSTSTSVNFITNNSRVTAIAKAYLPMEGRIKNLIIMDTLEISSANDFQKDYEVEYIEYKLNTENGFPFDCKFQGYFLDSVGTVKDSIVHINDIIMPAGKTDANGAVISSTKKYSPAIFTRERYKNVQKAKKLVFIGKFNTINNGDTDIKILSSYNIAIKLAAEVKAIIDLN